MSQNTKIGNLLKKYSDNTTLRAGVNAIPYVGGILDILLSSGIQKKSHDRFLIFLNELENHVQNAPITCQKFQTTPIFDITKEFICK